MSFASVTDTLFVEACLSRCLWFFLRIRETGLKKPVTSIVSVLLRPNSMLKLWKNRRHCYRLLVKITGVPRNENVPEFQWNSSFYPVFGNRESRNASFRLTGSRNVKNNLQPWRIRQNTRYLVWFWKLVPRSITVRPFMEKVAFKINNVAVLEIERCFAILLQGSS